MGSNLSCMRSAASKHGAASGATDQMVILRIFGCQTAARAAEAYMANPGQIARSRAAGPAGQPARLHASAAQLVKRFPLLLGAVANGELHLTGLLMLGPHLTQKNIANVLGRAKFRTKKKLANLVRELHPLPLVPDVIEPLCPERAPLRRPTWQQFVSSFAPAVRELPLGERPCDWTNDTPDVDDAVNASVLPALARAELGQAEASSPAHAPAQLGPPRTERPPVTRAAVPGRQLLRCELRFGSPLAARS